MPDRISDMSFAAQCWQLADKNHDGSLDAAELGRLLHKLNVKHSTAVAKELVAQLSGGKVTHAQFAPLIHQLDLMQLEDLRVYFEHAFGHADSASAVKFKQWLTTTQGMNDTESSQVVTKFAPGGTLTYQTFADFMLGSAEANAYDSKRIELMQDMSQPWQHYFVNSSHNTYLVGDQLESKSSVDAYKNALIRGCRCVELDVWDGANSDPIIMHGHTLTSKISFRDVIATIKQYAFVASNYPLILSLEVHCNVEQQAVMAQVLRSVLGDQLLTTPLTTMTVSPAHLLNKIVVKGKHSPAALAATESLPTQDSGSESDNESTVNLPTLAKPKADPHKFKLGMFTSKSLSMSSGSSKPKHISLSPELGQLAVYMQSRKLVTMEDVLDGTNVVSLSETKAHKYVMKKRAALELLSQRTFLRIYPKGTRVDSSNIEPYAYWQAGCQMAALNYQKAQHAMHINAAFYAQNRGCGWVLKPERLRTVSVASLQVAPKQIGITVISGYRLPKQDNVFQGEVIDPYVLVELFTPSESGADGKPSKQYKTHHVGNNGYAPSWTPLTAADVETSLHISQLKFTVTGQHEFSFIRFHVKDREVVDMKDDALAQAVIPVDCLQPGLRRVNLRAISGEDLQSGASLVVYVTIN